MKVNCTICQIDDAVVLKDGILSRYECNNCEHSFSVIDKERQIKYTDDYYVSKQNWFDNPNFRLFKFIYANMIRLLKKDEIKLLDVGCGKGDFLKFVKKINPRIQLYGIDQNDDRYSGINFIKGDFLKTEFGMKFDIVCSLAAIEHIDDVLLFVGKIDEILLPGGLLILTTDNTGGLLYKAARILQKMGISSAYHSLYELAHLQHFTNRSLKILMERSGFKIILQKNHNYPVRAVNLPPSRPIIKSLYLLGIRLFFSLPDRFGMLQTAFCRRREDL